jgi:hypothetical protein
VAAPSSEFPRDVIRTFTPDAELDVAFGSCRVDLPHRTPYTLSPDEDQRGREWDALYALALRMRSEAVARWPDRLLMLGDQVYVDEGSPGVRDRIRGTRDTSAPPGLGVKDFEEYTWVYRESWGDPVIRRLLSTVPSAMVWDDHDMHDNWNSERWVREMRREAWWHRRIEGGVMSYWIYQHLGSLRPAELRANELFDRVRRSADAGPLLRDFARRADREVEGTRWSYRRGWGRVRLVVIDSRAGRVLSDTRHVRHEHKRAIIDDHEWEWLERQCTGEIDHPLIASSPPVLIMPGCMISKRGTRRSATACGESAPPTGPSVCGATSTSSTGPPFRTPSTAWRVCSRRSAPAGAGTLRPRSACWAATSTTRTSPTSPSGGARVSAAAWLRRCARRFATTSTCADAGCCALPPRGLDARSGGRSRSPRAWRIPGSSGASPTGRTLTIIVATLRIRGRALELDIDVAGDPHPELERVCRRRLA